jgi:hypothetical protein
MICIECSIIPTQPSLGTSLNRKRQKERLAQVDQRSFLPLRPMWGPENWINWLKKKERNIWLTAKRGLLIKLHKFGSVDQITWSKNEERKFWSTEKGVLIKWHKCRSVDQITWSKKERFDLPKKRTFD